MQPLLEVFVINMPQSRDLLPIRLQKGGDFSGVVDSDFFIAFIVLFASFVDAERVTWLFRTNGRRQNSPS